MKRPQGVIGFLGQPGTGKTYRMMKIFLLFRRVVVYNFASGFGPPGKCKSNQNPLHGFVFVYNVPDLIQVLKAAGRGHVHVCFSPVRSDEDEKEVFNDVCQLVADFSKQCGAVAFAIDEVWNVQTPGTSPKRFKECLLQWRHYDLTILWTAQRPAETHYTMRSVSTEVYVGRVMAGADVAAVRDCAVPDEALALLPKLPNRQFVHRFDDGRWKVEKS